MNGTMLVLPLQCPQIVRNYTLSASVARGGSRACNKWLKGLYVDRQGPPTTHPEINQPLQTSVMVLSENVLKPSKLY